MNGVLRTVDYTFGQVDLRVRMIVLLRSSPRKRGPSGHKTWRSLFTSLSRRNGTLYVGMTDDLLKRIWQHRNDVIPGFAQTYNVKMLVWYESHGSRESVLVRERRLKKWNRAWKLDLIEQENPHWRDLWVEVAGSDT